VVSVFNSETNKHWHCTLTCTIPCHSAVGEMHTQGACARPTSPPPPPTTISTVVFYTGVYDCAPTPPRPKARSPLEATRGEQANPTDTQCILSASWYQRCDARTAQQPCAIGREDSTRWGSTHGVFSSWAGRHTGPLLRRPQTNQTPSNTTSGPPPAGQQRGSPRFFLSGRVWPRGNAARGAARGKGG